MSSQSRYKAIMSMMSVFCVERAAHFERPVSIASDFYDAARERTEEKVDDNGDAERLTEPLARRLAPFDEHWCIDRLRFGVNESRARCCLV